ALVKLRGVTIGKVTSISFIKKEQPDYKEQSVVILFEVPRDTGVITPGADVQQMLDKEVAHGLRARIETQGFLGPNGSGKTTTIRLLMGLLRPSEGRATILGRDCHADAVALKRDVGYLPDEPFL
ncbi:ATP-binding cassette domain-containing protein, partial [Lacticaseibacillus rhamnosus]